MERIGLQDMILDTILGLLLEWWWVIVLVVAIAILNEFVNGKRSHRSRRVRYSGKARRRGYRATPRKSRQREPTSKGQFGTASDVISGNAFVTDGDGIRVAGKEVRIVGIDAPEWNQMAQHSDGHWFNHGRIVKGALIEEIGGKHVRVLLEDTDKFERLIGTVIYECRDIGEWLVREGHAIAAYDNRYKLSERDARKEKRGMWAHAHNFDPRAHRYREARKH